MADEPNLNPKPVPGPADVKAKPLPKAPPIDAATETKGVWQGAFTAIGQAFEQVRKNPQPAMLVLGVYAVLSLLTFLTYDSATNVRNSYAYDFSYESLASLIFLLALPTYALAIADRKTISISQFMKFDLTRYLTIVGIFILSVLIVFFSIIPLVIFWIWTIPWIMFSTYVSVDQKLGPVQALKESKRLAQDNKAKAWGLLGVAILLSFAAGLLATVPVIGSVVAAFVSVLLAGATAILYRWLQRNVPAEATV